MEAQNAIYLDEETGGKGRQFKSRFLVPGLVKYDYGVCLLTKENADKFIQGFVGCPVVINHQTVTDDNAKAVSVGNIFSVWFDEKDGYYWCNGIINDKEAIDLINKGYSVSCQYTITEYSDNETNALHNGNPYDKIIENGKPEHLAIVNNPRYEGAKIAVNALLAENEDRWITIKPNGEENKGRHLLLKDGESPKEAIERVYKKEDKKEDKQKQSDTKDGKLYTDLLNDTKLIKHLKDSIAARKADNPDAKVGDTIIDTDSFISDYVDKLTTKEYASFEWDRAEKLIFDKLNEMEKEAGFKSDEQPDTKEDVKTTVKETKSAKLSDMLAPKPKKEQKPIKLDYVKQTRDGYALYENPKTKTMYMEKDGKFYDMKYREVKREFETDTAGDGKKSGDKKINEIVEDYKDYFNENQLKEFKKELARFDEYKGLENIDLKGSKETFKKLKPEDALEKLKRSNDWVEKNNKEEKLKKKFYDYVEKNDFKDYRVLELARFIGGFENLGIDKPMTLKEMQDDPRYNFRTELALKYLADKSGFNNYSKDKEEDRVKAGYDKFIEIVYGKDKTASNSFVSQFKDALYEAIAGGIYNRLGELIASNEDKWITIHPHGEESDDYRRLLIKDGETVEDAMHRQGYYNKRQAKEEKEQKEDKNDVSKKIDYKIYKQKEDELFDKLSKINIDDYKDRDEYNAEIRKIREERNENLDKLKEAYKKEIERIKNIDINKLSYQEIENFEKDLKDIYNDIMGLSEQKFLMSKLQQLADIKRSLEAKEKAKKVGGYTEKLQNLANFSHFSDISSYPIELQKHIYDNYKKVYDKFPQLAKQGYGKLAKENLKSSTYANNLSIVNSVTLNSSWYDDLPKLEKSYADDVSSEWHPQGTNYNSIITHELGHGLLGYIQSNLGVSGKAIRSKVLKKLGLHIKDINTHLSRYPNNSRDPVHEFFAEAFAEYMDSPNPRPLAVEFGKEIERILRDLDKS